MCLEGHKVEHYKIYNWNAKHYWKAEKEQMFIWGRIGEGGILEEVASEHTLEGQIGCEQI